MNKDDHGWIGRSEGESRSMEWHTVQFPITVPPDDVDKYLNPLEAGQYIRKGTVPSTPTLVRSYSWEYKTFDDFDPDQLPELGRQGWELCAVVPRKDNELWVFKRPMG